MTSVVEGTARPAAYSRAASESLGKALHDGQTMAALRAAAAESLERLSPPDPRRERPWKYMDMALLDLGRYAPGAGSGWTGNNDEIRGRFGLQECSGAFLAQLDGTTLLSRAADGVSISDFTEPLPGEHLGHAVVPDNLLTAVHYAFLRGGVAVQVAANVEAPEPVRIVREYVGDGQLGTPHTLITTGPNSRVTVIEEYRSDEANILALPAVEIFPGPGSQVRYVALHRWGANTVVVAEQRTVTDRESELISISVVTGGKAVKSHITGSLEGRGSASEVLGLVLGADHEYADFYTLQDHVGADTRSDLLIKSALEEASQSVYYGLTRVGLGARNADANQENRALLLSKRAKADSDPVLEILTNDVIRVSHGATAGPVDEEQLYYLESRGIDRAAAEDLLVRAFLGQVLDRVPGEALRAELETVVEGKLRRASS